MKPLVVYLCAIFLAVCGLLAFVEAIDPGEPVLLIDAAAPAPPAGGLFLALPPSFGTAPWCFPPTGKRDPKYVERT